MSNASQISNPDGPADTNVRWHFEGGMRVLEDRLGIDVVRSDRRVKAWSIFTLTDLLLRLNNLLVATGEKRLALRPEDVVIDAVHVKTDRSEIAVSLREVSAPVIWPVYVSACDAGNHAYHNQAASRAQRRRGRPSKKRKLVAVENLSATENPS